MFFLVTTGGATCAPRHYEFSEEPAARHARRDRLHERPAPGLLYDIQELIGAHVNAVAKIVSDDDSPIVRRGRIHRELWAATRALATETYYRNSMVLIIFHDLPPSLPSCKEIVRTSQRSVNIHEGNVFVTSYRPTVGDARRLIGSGRHPGAVIPATVGSRSV